MVAPFWLTLLEDMAEMTGGVVSPAELTVTTTAGESPVAPVLSVARAVRL